MWRRSLGPLMCPRNSNSRLKKFLRFIRNQSSLTPLILFLWLGLVPVAQAKRPSAVYRVYHDTLSAAEDASRGDLSARAISNIYLKGASQTRDLGGWKYVIEL